MSIAKGVYKVLGPGRTPHHGGKGVWPYRKWLEVDGELVTCRRGLHLCREQDLIHWLGPEIWRAEYDDAEVIDHGNKLVVRRARLVSKVGKWNERSARHFACDCAEHVLHLFEERRPKDTRPRNCIATARRYADGNATDEERAAAGDAAGDAAWAAAGDAAWAAVVAAAVAAAWAAALAAARAAARAAAQDAAWASAQDAEYGWQTQRLMQYLRGEA